MPVNNVAVVSNFKITIYGWSIRVTRYKITRAHWSGTRVPNITTTTCIPWREEPQGTGPTDLEQSEQLVADAFPTCSWLCDDLVPSGHDSLDCIPLKPFGLENPYLIRCSFYSTSLTTPLSFLPGF